MIEDGCVAIPLSQFYIGKRVTISSDFNAECFVIYHKYTVTNQIIILILQTLKSSHKKLFKIVIDRYNS